MKEKIELEEKLKEIEERVEFLKDVIRKYVLAGHNQFENSFEDWKKKQGIFRSSQLR